MKFNKDVYMCCLVAIMIILIGFECKALVVEMTKK